MKKLVTLLSLSAGLFVPAGSAYADHCENEPACCPTAAHCWVKEADVNEIEQVCKILGCEEILELLEDGG